MLHGLLECSSTGQCCNKTLGGTAHQALCDEVGLVELLQGPGPQGLWGLMGVALALQEEPLLMAHSLAGLTAAVLPAPQMGLQHGLLRCSTSAARAGVHLQR